MPLDNRSHGSERGAGQGPARRVSRTPARNGGFTLVELMTVVAIIGITATLGLVYLDSGQKGQSALGYAERLGAQYEMARARAVATQRRQRIVIQADRFTHWQSSVTGLAESADPTNYTTDWDYVYEAVVPQDVSIADVDQDLRFEAAETPTALMAFPVAIDVLPDGRARTFGSTEFFESGWTVFIGDAKTEVRTLLFAVTGSSTTYNEW